MRRGWNEMESCFRIVRYFLYQSIRYLHVARPLYGLERYFNFSSVSPTQLLSSGVGIKRGQHTWEYKNRWFERPEMIWSVKKNTVIPTVFLESRVKYRNRKSESYKKTKSFSLLTSHGKEKRLVRCTITYSQRVEYYFWGKKGKRRKEKKSLQSVRLRHTELNRGWKEEEARERK